MSASISVRPLTDLDEFGRCEALQVEVWGYEPLDTVPKRMFLVAQRAGGQVLGAFDSTLDGGAENLENMVGFAMSLPGYRNGHAYLHSHMLAVRASYRNYGIGRTLKFAQRDDALARGIELIEWTFDPLEIKNAYLNIEKLGAIARRYSPNIYGMTTSDLQAGLPTDRLYAEWWLRSKRVEAVVVGNMLPRIEPVTTVTVQGEIYDWKAKGDPRARELQERNRDLLEAAFAKGLAVTGYARGENGDGAFELARWDEAFKY